MFQFPKKKLRSEKESQAKKFDLRFMNISTTITKNCRINKLQTIKNLQQCLIIIYSVFYQPSLIKVVYSFLNLLQQHGNYSIYL
jgi:hypothetical protein